MGIVTDLSIGNNKLVVGIAGQVIKILEYVLIPASPVSLVWKSGPTALTGSLRLGGSGPAQLSREYSPHGHHVTEDGDDLILSLSGQVDVQGFLMYTQQAP